MITDNSNIYVGRKVLVPRNDTKWMSWLLAEVWFADNNPLLASHRFVVCNIAPHASVPETVSVASQSLRNAEGLKVNSREMLQTDAVMQLRAFLVAIDRAWGVGRYLVTRESGLRLRTAIELDVISRASDLTLDVVVMLDSFDLEDAAMDALLRQNMELLSREPLQLVVRVVCANTTQSGQYNPAYSVTPGHCVNHASGLHSLFVKSEAVVRFVVSFANTTSTSAMCRCTEKHGLCSKYHADMHTSCWIELADGIRAPTRCFTQ